MLCELVVFVTALHSNSVFVSWVAYVRLTKFNQFKFITIKNLYSNRIGKKNNELE